MNPMPTLRRVTSRAAIAALTASLFAIPVAASQLEHEVIASTDSFMAELCGEDWSVVETTSGFFVLKAGQHDGPPRFFANLRAEAVYTDPDDPDRGFILSSNDLQKDLRATLVTGTTYQIDNIHVGQPSVVSTLDGQTLARDRGRITWSFTIDTMGDDDPGNDVLLGSEIVDVAGPHPSPGDDELCDLIDSING